MDLQERLAEFARRLSRSELLRHARRLGLGEVSLVRLGVARHPRGLCFPMLDATGRVIGIRVRRFDGSKRAVPGSRNGLFMPRDLSAGQVLFLPEGATDTAALLDLGFTAAGRPDCRGGVRHALALVQRLRPKSVVVASDRDLPGRAGAAGLAAALRPFVPSVRVIEPPEGVKDIRAWRQAGAAREDVLAAVEAARSLTLTLRPSRRERSSC